MWRIKRITHHVLLAILLVILGNVGFLSALADTTAVPSLTISQLKVTSSNGQFVTLYNPTTSTLNMSNYQLEYFNSFDLSKATSSKLISLSGVLPPHSYYMVNDGTLQLCYQLTVDSVSLGFSSTAGLVQVLALSQKSPGGLVATSLQDYVGWSKTDASGAQTLPASTSASLLRQPVDAKNNPFIAEPGSGSWRPVLPDPATACGLIAATGSNTATVSTGLSQLILPTEPPVTIVGLDMNVATARPATLPPADIGLMAPQITELLPNPPGTGTDATDEYIELYNANDVPFDLSGFLLESGLSTLHDYSFPAGASLAPHTFTAFHASLTNLTLSNSGGQVRLLDPLGNSIAVTEAYGVAADGQGWALANGKWYWSTQPTPNAANIIKQPPAKKAAAKTSKKLASPKKSVNSNKKLKTATTAAGFEEPEVSKIPIHPWQLALVGSLAILYGIYEYRKDLANQLRKLKPNFGSGEGSRQKSARRRSNSAGE